MLYTIVAEQLGKRFYRYHVDRPRTLRETLIRGLSYTKPKEVFWGLRDVSFSIEAGSMVGVIGSNGAGKSTLLRLIGGIELPDKGSVEVHGRVGAFLDLKAGLRPDLTGRENVFIGGVVAGLTRREVTQQFDSIIAFAELEEFVDNPVYTYSTGMQMRLAFAISAHTQPEILLIDEVLAVGDIAFRRKCFDRIQQFKQNGCTILLVTHDHGQVQTLCDQAIWLRAGSLVAYGQPEEIVNRYVDDVSLETRRRTSAALPAASSQAGAQLRINQNRFGSQEMQIVAVRLLDRTGAPITELASGDSLSVEIEYHAPQPMASPIFGVAISQGRQKVCSVTTAGDRLPLPTLQARGKISLHFDRLDLAGGEYFVDVGVYEREWAYAYDYHWRVYPLFICTNGTDKGILCPPHRWEVAEAHSVKARLPNLEAV